MVHDSLWGCLGGCLWGSERSKLMIEYIIVGILFCVWVYLAVVPVKEGGLI